MNTKYKLGEEVTLKVGHKTFNVVMLDTEPVKVTNPYSGESCVLEPLAAQVHDFIKGAEMFGNYENVRIGLDYFSKHWPSEYMTLLD